MQTHLVRRRGIAASASELDAALTRLRSFEEEPGALQVRWLHSYALREADGRFGLACVLQADGVSALRRHAELTRLRAEEIVPVTAQLQLRPFAPTLVYLIRRRRAWATRAELDRSAALARRLGDEKMAQQLIWLRSYLLREDDGSFGTACLFQSVGPEVLVEHAQRVGMPADEVTPVLGRIVFREEPPSQATATDAAAA